MPALVCDVGQYVSPGPPCHQPERLHAGPDIRKLLPSTALVDKFGASSAAIPDNQRQFHESGAFFAKFAAGVVAVRVDHSHTLSLAVTILYTEECNGLSSLAHWHVRPKSPRFQGESVQGMRENAWVCPPFALSERGMESSGVI